MVKKATKSPYQPTDLVVGPRTDWIKHKLRDMGLFDSDVDQKVRSGVENYIARLFKDCGIEMNMTMRDFEDMVNFFWQGYE